MYVKGEELRMHFGRCEPKPDPHVEANDHSLLHKIRLQNCLAVLMRSVCEWKTGVLQRKETFQKESGWRASAHRVHNIRVPSWICNKAESMSSKNVTRCYLYAARPAHWAREPADSIDAENMVLCGCHVLYDALNFLGKVLIQFELHWKSRSCRLFRITYFADCECCPVM